MSQKIKYLVVAILAISLPIALYLAQKSGDIRQRASGGQTLYVSASGKQTNAGTDPSSPLLTIQSALDKAIPGTTIILAPGIYRERPITKIHGTSQAPITIKGPEIGKDKASRYKATLFNTSRIFNIDHNYYILEGFTIDGQEKLKDAAYPTTISQARAFKDSVQSQTADGRLIYIGSSDTSRNVKGTIIRNMFLHGGGGECVRIRNNAQETLVHDSVIQWCGLYGKGDDIERYKYHNGEGVYIGTSPKSTTQPMYANDTSSNTIVRNNTIHTFGSECFNTKENTHDNLFEGNDCRFNDEPSQWDGSLIELRGHNTTLIGNTIGESRGWGLKMRSDSTSYDKGGNSAQNNTFINIASQAIFNDQKSAGLFCGNMFTNVKTVNTGNPIGNPTVTCPSRPISTIAPTTVATSPTLIPTILPTKTITPTRPITPSPTTPSNTDNNQVRVVSFTLINADTDKPIAGYENIPAGSLSINLSSLPTTRLNFKANTSPSKIGSVRFTYDGKVRNTESSMPYAFAGDSDNNNYSSWTPSTGAHIITATPYSKSDAKGDTGSKFTLYISVTSSQQSKDSSSPAISILSPIHNIKIKAGSTINLSAFAEDNVAITKVEFNISGSTSFTCSDASAPYGCLWNVPPASGTYTITAKAYDPAGNTPGIQGIQVRAE